MPLTSRRSIGLNLNLKLLAYNLAVPTKFLYTDRMKNNISTEALEQVTYFPIPEGVDIDIVAEIIGDDMYDIIFLEDGILCSHEQADTVREAILEAHDEEVEDEE